MNNDDAYRRTFFFKSRRPHCSNCRSESVNNKRSHIESTGVDVSCFTFKILAISIGFNNR